MVSIIPSAVGGGVCDCGIGIEPLLLVLILPEPMEIGGVGMTRSECELSESRLPVGL